MLPITVAALMTPKWLQRHLRVKPDSTMVLVPGWLDQSVDQIQSFVRVPVLAGPREIRDLPQFFGQKFQPKEGYGAYTIEILAELNHANRMSTLQVIAAAEALRRDGADIVDLGGTPGEEWPELREQVHELVQRGIRVSIDTFDHHHVEQAVAQGAELVLSVNSHNRQAAVDWGCEVVVVPDQVNEEKTFFATIDFLREKGVRMRLDPILEPIGCGLAPSLVRYARLRQRFPDARMLMGIGNITELTDADSAGINLLLLGVCQELGIQSVLTTQVINWARTSVRECDVARRLVHFACQQGVPPKNIESNLVMLRDERLHAMAAADIEDLARSIRDKNFRIFVASGEIHAIAAGAHFHAEDPFELMQQILDAELGTTLSAGHAFYLGFEFAKAETALQLSKQYTQDEPLDWGYLTDRRRHRRID
ncbi:MAG: dihydropteroate synthase [Planctomycetota bacterium]|nr:MAG: dihydropteroate synthase [Planctomycetota bacterium]